MLLEGRKVIVSGVGPGVGRELVRALAENGADVALAARSEDALEASAKEVRERGRQALVVPTDLTRAEDCARLVERAHAELGRIDGLVQNAYHPGTYNLFEDDDLENYRAPLEVNLLGSLRLIQRLVPVLKSGGGGSIVLVNSMIVRRVLPTMHAYAASKAALLAASRGLAAELGGHGIRVNSILPGYIWGPALEGYFEMQARARGVDPQVIYDETAQHIPLGHIPDSREIADAALLFLSPLSRAITGQALDVNGGQEMY